MTAGRKSAAILANGRSHYVYLIRGDPLTFSRHGISAHQSRRDQILPTFCGPTVDDKRAPDLFAVKKYPLDGICDFEYAAIDVWLLEVRLINGDCCR